MDKKRAIVLGLCAMSLFIFTPKNSVAYLQEPTQSLSVFNGYLSYNRNNLNNTIEDTSDTEIPSNDVIVETPIINDNLNSGSTPSTPVNPDKNNDSEELPKEDTTVDIETPENGDSSTETPAEPSVPDNSLEDNSSENNSSEDNSTNTSDSNIKVQN